MLGELDNPEQATEDETTSDDKYRSLEKRIKKIMDDTDIILTLYS